MSYKALAIFYCSLFMCVNAHAYKKGDLHFVANQGQWDSRAVFMSEVDGGAVFFTKKGFTYNFYDKVVASIAHDNTQSREVPDSLSWHAYNVSFANSRIPEIVGGEKETFYHNYYLGNDKSKWVSNVPVYEAVQYKGVYNGVNIDVYSNGKSLKYDLIVQPGGHVADIQLKFDGVTPRLNAEGEIVIKTSVNTVTEQAPYVYQVVNGKQVQVPCKYVLDKGVVSFDVSEYDKSLPLIIDPSLIFATYSGSSGEIWAYCSTYDNDDHFYAVSVARATGFPATPGAYNTSYTDQDIAVSKYNTAGSNLLYATYCGGSSAETPTAATVNSNNQLVISGYTVSQDYPITKTGYDTTYNQGEDIFVTVFKEDGSALIGSTYVGGSGNDGEANYNGSLSRFQSGLSTDKSNNIYIATTTKSSDFPTTSGVFQDTIGQSGFLDGCIFKMTGNCSSLIYSTYLGGASEENIFGCKLRSDGSLIVSGYTGSSNFPVTSGAYSSQGNGFVSIINSTATGIVASTRLGANTVRAMKVSTDDLGNIYVAGNSATSLTVSSGVYYQTGGRVFISKLSSDLKTQLLRTKIVDVPEPEVIGFNNVCEEIAIAVFTKKVLQQPVTSNAYLQLPTVYYFLNLNSAFDTVRTATFYGSPADTLPVGCHVHSSSAIDTNGIIWLAACNSYGKRVLTGTIGSFSPNSKNIDTTISDHFSAKFDMEVRAAKPIAMPVVPDTGCIKEKVYFSNISRHSYEYVWHFGDGDTSHAKMPAHSYDTSGIFVVTLEAYNPYSCKLVDVVTDTIYIDSVKMNAEFSAPDTVCLYESFNTVNTTKKGIDYLWDFGDGDTSIAFNATHAYDKPGWQIVKLIGYNPALCNHTDTFIHNIYVDSTDPGASFTIDTNIVCFGAPITFHNTTQNGISYEWDFDDNETSIVTNPVHGFSKWGTLNPRLIATNTNLCVPKDTAFLPVVVKRPLEVELHDTFICGYDPVDWTIKVLYTYSNISYQWSPTNAILSASNKQTARVDPSKSLQYVVTVKDSIPGMCAHTVKDTANLIIVEYPKETFAISNSPLCEGDTLVLEAGTTSNLDRLIYEWEGPEGYISHEYWGVRGNVKVEHSGTYRVAIDNQGCAINKDVEVVVNPKPKVTATSNSPVYIGDSLLLQMTSQPKWDSLIWYGPADFASNLEKPIIRNVQRSATGAYTVEVYSKGCKGSAITNVRVDEPDSQYVKLYPNPNNGRFLIEGKGHLEQNIELLVVNVLGQKIYTKEIATKDKYFKYEVVLPATASGAYVLWLVMDAKYWIIPFSVIRD